MARRRASIPQVCCSRLGRAQSGKLSRYIPTPNKRLTINQRSFQIVWGDRASLVLRAVSAVIQALVCGSIFYNLSNSSESVFLRPGALFFGVLYFGLQSLAETTGAFFGRPILSRQKRFAFYRPTAYCISLVLVDIPVYMLQVTLFTIVLYFMCHFQFEAAKFFTYWILQNHTLAGNPRWLGI